jgi:hypothetical protein
MFNARITDRKACSLLTFYRSYSKSTAKAAMSLHVHANRIMAHGRANSSHPFQIRFPL